MLVPSQSRANRSFHLRNRTHAVHHGPASALKISKSSCSFSKLCITLVLATNARRDSYIATRTWIGWPGSLYTFRQVNEVRLGRVKLTSGKGTSSWPHRPPHRAFLRRGVKGVSCLPAVCSIGLDSLDKLKTHLRCTS